ncbi:MAG: ATP-dependent DNA helicase [Leptolyngbyaceae cyanobacterium MO_188.B28]|nr:ATP-dependent DNA helicase [Leptolyngbyaceae cyanobacterium MO_188.B28]
MIEAEVHQRLRAFLREQGEPYWPHHLTMARLVARALRLGRSALIQAGSSSAYHGRYRLSYLMPVLLWPDPVILVLPEAVRQRILMVEIPRLRQWMPILKPVHVSDSWPNPDFRGLLLTTPQAWLADRLTTQTQFPDGVPTLLDGVDDLETWAHTQLTAEIGGRDWDSLMMAYPGHQNLIRDIRVKLTRAIFQHPTNPYNCYLVDEPEQQILTELYEEFQSTEASSSLTDSGMPDPWRQFWRCFHQPEKLIWSTITRRQGQFSLHCGPIEIASAMAEIWPQQPLVLIGAAIDQEVKAPVYRQRVGLGDVTCLKFSLDRQQELIQLYLPERLPMPNTSEFQRAMMREIYALLSVGKPLQGPTVVLVGDTPLKAQVGSMLAAEFGSRVQVEKTCPDDNGILVTGWEFWRDHQGVFPAPQLLIIATLPIPSLENPLVASRVAYYKRLRQDWFRLYLLPEALSELQRAIAPVRNTQGIVAILDNRVNYRSYGRQILSALSPAARTNYIDENWFNNSECKVLD